MISTQMIGNCETLQSRLKHYLIFTVSLITFSNLISFFEMNRGNIFFIWKKILWVIIKRLRDCIEAYYDSWSTSEHKQLLLMGHDHLLEIRLLEKSARHDFIIARHCSSNNIFSCQLLENQKSWKIICRTCISSSFTFRQNNINCSKIKCSTKVVENVNCSTQFIVKKMLYMYGS